MQKRSWIKAALAAVLVSGAFAGLAGIALGEGGTTGDISWSAVWKQGAGSISSLHVKNTGSGTTISDFTFQIAGGAQIASVIGGGCATTAFGGGSLPAGEIQCGSPLDPGHGESISITTVNALAGGTGGTFVFSDDGESPQPAVHVKLHGKAHHKKKHHKKKKHHRKKKHHK